MTSSDSTSMNHDNELVKSPSRPVRPELVPTVSYAAPLAAITSNPEQSPDTYTENEKTYLERTSSSSSISTEQPQHHDLEHAVSRVSTDPLGNTYPDGGREAYTVVFGSFCGCMLSLGESYIFSSYPQMILTSIYRSHEHTLNIQCILDTTSALAPG